MKRKLFSTFFIAILVVTSTLSQVVLVTPSTKGEIPNAPVEFLNAPVLFKEGGNHFSRLLPVTVPIKPGKLSLTEMAKRS